MITTEYAKGEVIIVTETVDGAKYMISADSIREIYDDWYGDCNSVPENDAPVYFAMCDGERIDTDDSTFGDIMALLEIRLDD